MQPRPVPVLDEQPRKQDELEELVHQHVLDLEFNRFPTVTEAVQAAMSMSC